MKPLEERVAKDELITVHELRQYVAKGEARNLVSYNDLYHCQTDDWYFTFIQRDGYLSCYDKVNKGMRRMENRE